MRAVIYARYSSDNQTEASIEGQLRECMEYATYNDIQVIGNYIDRAYSAKTDNRPEFQRMIKDSYKHAFDCIIVWKLDRFSRNRYDSAHYKALLRKNGVKVVSAKETIAEGSEGILLESVLEGMAEFYSAELAEKVTRGMKENALKGLWNGGNTPFGYVVNTERKLDIDSKAAPIVAEIFKMSNDGKAVKEIFNIMSERKVTRSNGKPLRYNAIRYMLSNRVYIGEYSHMGVVIKNSVPPIVSEELFNAVQKGYATEILLKRLAELEKEQNELNDAIAKEQLKAPIFTQDHFRMALNNFQKIDISTQDGKRKIIDAFINSIYLYDDHMKIVYNANGKEETVSLEELESSILFSSGAPSRHTQKERIKLRCVCLFLCKTVVNCRFCGNLPFLLFLRVSP